ncbi:unnamed protein product [Orchesella dallaii]|uniref:Uncharacterized protein n=1 Tax=Orchesella dallaii TaxID=48710 RepID=A0ABP1Q749_9HEXA
MPNKIDTSRTRKGYHRPRSRERDQRMPTFQVLEKLHHNNPSEVKRIEPPPVHHQAASPKRKSKSPYNTSPSPTARRHSHHEAPKDRNHSASQSPGKKSVGSNGSCGGNSYRSNINSGRAPACSFANQFYGNCDQRSRSYSPKKKIAFGKQTGVETGEDEEPSDVIVWDTARKASRSNILCPLTDSEFRGVAVEQKKTRIIKQYNVALKTKSVPKVCRFTQSSVAIALDDSGSPESLDDQLPPTSPKEATSTVSIHSTSKHKIDLIGKQLDEIYNVQNDILNQLEDSIASTHTENVELQNEILALKHNNKNLVYLLNDMSDELERMKHIFRSRGLPLPVSSNRLSSPSTPSTKTKSDKNEVTQTPPSTSTSAAGQQRSRSREKSVAKSSSPSSSRKRSRSRSREEDLSNSKPEVKHNPGSEGRGETPIEVSVIKERKSRDKGKQHEKCKAIDPYHTEETDSSIFRNDSESSVNALGADLEAIVTIGRSKKRSKETNKTVPSDKSSKKSSKERRKSSNSDKNRDSDYAYKSDATSTIESVDGKGSTKRKSSKRGCFGLFNFLWPKNAYAQDSEDNIVTLNDI